MRAHIDVAVLVQVLSTRAGFTRMQAPGLESVLVAHPSINVNYNALICRPIHKLINCKFNTSPEQ